MKSIICGILLVFLIISCNNTAEITTIRSINIEEIEQPLPLDSIFSQYELFAIKEPLFGYVFYIEELEDKLVIKVQNDNFGVLLYDISTGESVSLAKRGNGPGEFSTIGMPEKSKNGFYLADRMRKKVMKFSSEGELINTIDIPLQFDKLIMKDYPLLYSFLSLGNSTEKGGDHEIVIFDLMNDSAQAKYLPLDNDLELERGIAGYYPLHTINDEVVLFRPLRDTIYTIGKDTISPRFIIDSRGRGVPQDFLNDPDVGLVEFFETIKDSDYFWFFIDFQETKNHAYLTFTKNMERCSAFYDKRSGITSLGKGFRDNLIFGKDFSYHDMMPVGSGENCMYFALDPIAILNNEVSVPGLIKPAIAENLSEDDNRLIVKFYFK